MIEITGKYNTAKVFASVIEDECIAQLKTLLDQPFVEGETIRVQADTHTGAGCVIGFTQTIDSGKICPNLVGVDISCGMLVVELGKVDIDLERFDQVVHATVPSGRNIHEGRKYQFPELKELKCYRELSADCIHRAERSISTLGGGNHFLELDRDDEGNIYLVIHSGSRNLGKHAAEYYQALANKLCNHKFADFDRRKHNLIEQYKAEGRKQEIQKALIALKNEYTVSLNNIPYDLAYLSGEYYDDYLHDMDILRRYAELNRYGIAKNVLSEYFGSFKKEDYVMWETLHNYIDTDQKILRKGSIDVSLGKKVLIPINMKDGSLICEGLGNPDYNFSAPHGAGRLMSRTKAREAIKLEDFKKSMEGIYTTCVNEDTIDESCFAYKTLDMILPNIQDTVKVVKRILPIYNFKSVE